MTSSIFIWVSKSQHADDIVPFVQNSLDFSEFKTIGCGELSARKGHNYLSVFADLKAKQVIYATEGKDASTWHHAEAEQIEQVSIDIIPAYQKGARDNCPDAAVIFNRFHVVQTVGKAVDEVRRREHRSLCRKGDQSLKESMWLWRNNPEKLDEYQTAHLDNLKQANLTTAKAYQMRLTLPEIYSLAEPTLFNGKLLAWCCWGKTYGKFKGYLFKPMVSAAKSILDHLEGIVNFAESRITNALMKGLNSVFSGVKRKARGFRSNQNLICMLYFVAGKLKVPSLT